LTVLNSFHSGRWRERQREGEEGKKRKEEDRGRKMAGEIEIEIGREREREIASVPRLGYKSHRGVYQSGIFVRRVPRVLFLFSWE